MSYTYKYAAMSPSRFPDYRSKCEGYESNLELTDELDDGSGESEKKFNIGLDDPIVHVLRNRDGDIVKTFRKSDLSGVHLNNTAMLIRIVTLEYQVEVLNNTLMDLLGSFRHLNQKKQEK